jgi:hypothetical protein
MHSHAQGTDAVFEFEFAGICVDIAVTLLLSGMLRMRGWAVTKSALANVARNAIPPSGSVTTGAISDDWKDARLSSALISQVLCVIAGLYAYILFISKLNFSF